MKKEFCKIYPSIEFSHAVDSCNYWVTAAVEVSGHVSLGKANRWYWGAQCYDTWTEVDCENSTILNIKIQNELIDDDLLSIVSCPHVLAQCEHEAIKRATELANEDGLLFGLCE